MSRIHGKHPQADDKFLQEAKYHFDSLWNILDFYIYTKAFDCFGIEQLPS